MFQPLSIDSAAIKQYLNRLRDVSENEQSFWESIEIMVDIILHEYETSNEDPYMQLMCVRGLLLLVINEKFADYLGQGVSEKILTILINILGGDVSYEKRQITDLAQHVPAIKFISVMPKKLMHEIIMQLQNILTLNIIQGTQINFQLFTETIKVLDIFHWLNFAFKDQSEQIDKKEFHNDAVNNNLDLRQLMD